MTVPSIITIKPMLRRCWAAFVLFMLFCLPLQGAQAPSVMDARISDYQALNYERLFEELGPRASSGAPLFVFDLETTGLSTRHDRIVQLGYVKVGSLGIMKTCVELVNPEKQIPERATAVHGIGNVRVRDQHVPTFAMLASRLTQEMEGCIVVGYNSERYDWPLLMKEFDRVGIHPPTIQGHIDVLRLARERAAAQLGEKPASYKLTYLYRRYTGQELRHAHDALGDVQATLVLLYHLTLHGQSVRLALAEPPPTTVIDNEERDVPTIAVHGKHLGESILHVLATDPAYLYWMVKYHKADAATQEAIEVLKERVDRSAWMDAHGLFLASAEGEALFNFGRHRGERVAAVMVTDRPYVQSLVRSQGSYLDEESKEIVKGLLREAEGQPLTK